MTDNKDDFGLMDDLQDDIDAAVDEALPFEPAEELREETRLEEAIEDESDNGVEAEAVDERPIELSIFGDPTGFEADVSEEFEL